MPSPAGLIYEAFYGMSNGVFNLMAAGMEELGYGKPGVSIRKEIEYGENGEILGNRVVETPRLSGWQKAAAISLDAVSVIPGKPSPKSVGPLLLSKPVVGKQSAVQVAKQLVKETKEFKVASYMHKHVASSKVPWSKIVEGTKSGSAKFVPGTDVEKLTLKAWEEGADVTSGKPWKAFDAGKTIGAYSGKETQYMRVEMTESTKELHAHPISKEQYQKLTTPTQ